jgi:DNA-binding NarL/FixJ family response regulator
MLLASDAIVIDEHANEVDAGGAAQDLAPCMRLGGREYVVVAAPEPDLGAYRELTDAEREVCRAVYDGASDDDIADARGTSTSTVANQLSSIFEKLDVSSRYELVARLADDASG